MNIEFNLLPENARVWVYAAERLLSASEQEIIKVEAFDFTNNWTAHQVPLNASYQIIKDVFVVFAVDIATNDISGCGIDKSVHLVQKWQQQFAVNFFNRMQLEYLRNDDLIIASKADVSEAFHQSILNENTPFYNKTVVTVNEMNSKFIIPLKESWVYSQLVKHLV